MKRVKLLSLGFILGISMVLMNPGQASAAPFQTDINFIESVTKSYDPATGEMTLQIVGSDPSVGTSIINLVRENNGNRLQTLADSCENMALKAQGNSSGMIFKATGDATLTSGAKSLIIDVNLNNNSIDSLTCSLD